MAVYWLHRTHVHVNNRMFVACFHVTVYVTMTIYLQRLSSKCVCQRQYICGILIMYVLMTRYWFYRILTS